MAGREDGSAGIWSTESATVRHDMKRPAAEGAEGGSGGGDEEAAHDDEVTSLCSVGEGMVASGGEEGAVRVWSTKDGQLCMR